MRVRFSDVVGDAGFLEKLATSPFIDEASHVGER
jgi:hypothetical protein